MARAKHYCAVMDLPFENGPYIAFFDRVPNIPTFQLNDKRKYVIADGRPTAPLYVLKFGGLDQARSLRLITALEEEILRADGVGWGGAAIAEHLRWRHRLVHLASWCSKAREKLGGAVEVLKFFKGKDKSRSESNE